MAYMCVLAPSMECNGCGTCQEDREIEYDNSDFEYEYARDDEYIREQEELL